MKEIHAILKLYENHHQKGEKAALAQVIRVEESSYRREGARMLVYESGTFVGGISGGCLEGDALKKSKIALLKNEPSVVTYDTSQDDEHQIGVGLGCNGVIDVLLTPIQDSNDVIKNLKKCVEERKNHILITITESNHLEVQTGDSYFFNEQQTSIENFRDKMLEKKVIEGIMRVKEKKKSGIYTYTTEDGVGVSAFIEYIPAPVHAVLLGDNYDVYAMLDVMHSLGWKTSLVGKLLKLDKQKLTKADDLYTLENSHMLEIDDRTAIILMAHDYRTDFNNLIHYVPSKSTYIGVLGPKKRFNKMVKEYQDFHNKTFDSEAMNKIFSPCGLEIGANSPEEIALSVASEILCVLNNKQGGMLKHKKGAIHV